MAIIFIMFDTKYSKYIFMDFDKKLWNYIDSKYDMIDIEEAMVLITSFFLHYINSNLNYL